MRIPSLLTLGVAFASFVSFAGAQEVTFNVSGTYSANTPTSRFTASNTSFLIEFTVPKSVLLTALNSPTAFSTPILSGSYSFEGRTYQSTSTSYFSRSDSAGNLEMLSLNTAFGTIDLGSINPYHTPFFSTRNNNRAVFLTGDLGEGAPWSVSYQPTTGTAVNVYTVELSEVEGR